MVKLILLELLWAREPPTAAILDSPSLAREPEYARPMESGQEKSHSANVNYNHLYHLYILVSFLYGHDNVGLIY